MLRPCIFLTLLLLKKDFTNFSDLKPWTSRAAKAQEGDAGEDDANAVRRKDADEIAHEGHSILKI